MKNALRNCEKWSKVRVEGFRICVLGQARDDKSISVRRVEGFGVCFWVKHSTKSQNGRDKLRF